VDTTTTKLMSSGAGKAGKRPRSASDAAVAVEADVGDGAPLHARARLRADSGRDGSHAGVWAACDTLALAAGVMGAPEEVLRRVVAVLTELGALLPAAEQLQDALTPEELSAVRTLGRRCDAVAAAAACIVPVTGPLQGRRYIAELDGNPIKLEVEALAKFGADHPYEFFAPSAAACRAAALQDLRDQFPAGLPLRLDRGGTREESRTEQAGARAFMDALARIVGWLFFSTSETGGGAAVQGVGTSVAAVSRALYRLWNGSLVATNAVVVAPLVTVLCRVGEGLALAVPGTLEAFSWAVHIAQAVGVLVRHWPGNPCMGLSLDALHVYLAERGPCPANWSSVMRALVQFRKTLAACEVAETRRVSDAFDWDCLADLESKRKNAIAFLNMVTRLTPDLTLHRGD